MYSNNCESCIDVMTGIHAKLIATKTKTTNLPTTSSSFSFVFGRIILYMSTVKMVEVELKIELRDEVRAANITDIINPRRPLGTYSVTNLTKAKLVHPYLYGQIRCYSSTFTLH